MVVNPSQILNEVIELFVNGEAEYKSCGISSVDALWQIRCGETSYITGYPTSGKSVFLRNVRRHLTEAYSWRHLVFDPEEGNLQRRVIKIALNHLALNRFSYDKLPDHALVAKKLKDLIPWLSQSYAFLDYPNGMPLWAEIMADCTNLKKTWNFQTLTIDPWSYLKFAKKGENYSYMEDALGDFNSMCKTFDIHGFVIAHPRKPTAMANGKLPIPTPYEISGTSEWFNKADNLIAIHRETDLVKFVKLKTKDNGITGEVDLKFNIKTGQYLDFQEFENKRLTSFPQNINGITGAEPSKDLSKFNSLNGLFE